MEKQEGARGTERWNRSEREREGATLAPLFLHHSSERFHCSVLPWSFLGPSLVFPRSFPGLSSLLPFLSSVLPFLFFSFSSPLPLQVFVTDAAAEAFLLVAVFLLQLDEGLAVAGVFHHQAALLPHPYYVVVLGLQLL